MADEVIKVEDLKRLDVRAGDRFVFMSERELSEQEACYVKEMWKEFMGDNIPLMILMPGFSIGVIRPQED